MTPTARILIVLMLSVGLDVRRSDTLAPACDDDDCGNASAGLDDPPTQRRRAGGVHEAQLRGRSGRDAAASAGRRRSSPSRSSARARAATARCRALR